MQLVGELTFRQRPHLAGRAFRRRAGVDRIDVSGVTQVDSAGLALISAFKRQAGRNAAWSA